MRGPVECDFFGFGPMRHHHGHGLFMHHPFGHHGPHHHGPHGHHGPRGHLGPWMRPHFFRPRPSDGDCRCSGDYERTDRTPGPKDGHGHPKKGPGCPFGRGGEGPGPMDGPPGCRPFGRGPWGRGCHKRGGEDRLHSPERGGHCEPMDAPPGCPMNRPFGRGPWGRGCHRRGGEGGPGSPERDGPNRPMDGPPGCPMDISFGCGPWRHGYHRHGKDHHDRPACDGPAEGCHRRGDRTGCECGKKRSDGRTEGEMLLQR